MEEIYNEMHKEEQIYLTKTSIRFILNHRFRIFNQYFEEIITTDCYDELKKYLSIGGFNHDGDFEQYQLIGAELIKP